MNNPRQDSTQAHNVETSRNNPGSPPRAEDIDTLKQGPAGPTFSEEEAANTHTAHALDAAVADWKEAALAIESLAGVPVPEESLPPQIGRYRILRRLGAGGMGTVYLAQDPQLDRVVALKVPSFDEPRPFRAVAMQRFLREARVAGRIRHPNICPLYDVGEHEGTPYTVMAYIEGPTLAQLLKQGRMNVRWAAEITRKMALALEALHQAGVIHRDVKPGNILLDPSGEPLLTDFGLARPLSDSERLTREGAVLGTPGFMAPEQATGDTELIGPWTDVYSLGVVLYRCVSGRMPFEGHALKVLYQSVNELPPLPSRFVKDNLNLELESIVMKTLARRPEERYRRAHDLAAALEGWLTLFPAPPPELETLEETLPKETPTPSPELTTPGHPPAVVVSGLPGGQTVRIPVPPTGKGSVRVSISGEARRKTRRKRWTITVSISTFLGMVLILGLLWTYEWFRNSLPDSSLPFALGGGGHASSLTALLQDIPIDPEPRLDIVFGKDIDFQLRRFGLKTRPGDRELIAGDGGSNSTILRIDSEESQLGLDRKEWVEDQRNLGNAPWGQKVIGRKSVWLVKGKIQVTQVVELVPNEVAQLEGDSPRRALDCCRIRYLLENKDEAAHTVELRMLLNVRAGDTRGPSFVVAGKPGLTAVLDPKREVPDFVQALEKPDVRAPGVVLQIAPKLGGAEPPQRLLLTQFDENLLDQYNINPTEVLSSAAVVLYWKEQKLDAKATREVSFVCGVGHVLGDASGQLGVSLGGALRPSTDRAFTVTAYVQKPAPGQRATLQLPPGLELAAGEKDSPEIPAPLREGELSAVSWQVKADWAGRFVMEVKLGEATVKKEVFIDQPVQPVYPGKTVVALMLEPQGGHKYKVKAVVTQPEDGQEIKLVLPDGMERTGGNETAAVPAPPEGSQVSTVEWTVRGTPEEPRPIRIVSSTGVVLSKFVPPP
jgi:serine/threonine protein kinase